MKGAAKLLELDSKPPRDSRGYADPPRLPVHGVNFVRGASYYGLVAGLRRGLISQYNLTEHEGVRNLFCIVTKQIENAKGLLNLNTSICLEEAPSALIELFSGRNVGKQVVRIAEYQYDEPKYQKYFAAPPFETDIQWLL
ncbi:hypothetical protein IFM89_021811 [Coptis chinensis]|uniref:Uncharacterized protein n=1 Tax=Coptis chinensis TaxID=261450 RepID=A0A835IRT3_9MAGN|nr:hypothetical protein IFM89_021811 [Coptis chinensis]